MNKMSVLGLTFVDIDGQSLAFFQFRIPIFTRNIHTFLFQIERFLYKMVYFTEIKVYFSMVIWSKYYF